MVDITPYIVAVLSILGIIWSYFIVPYIKSKHTTEEIRQGMAEVDSVIQIIRIFVTAAEQLGKNCGWTGEIKNEYVQTRLRELGYTISPDVKDIIEAEVLRLHNELLTVTD